MKLLDKLERKFGSFAIPNLTVYLIAGQTFFYVLYLTGKLERGVTLLSASLLQQGDWWRLLTFPFDPPRQSPLFVLFAWYLFYLMGSAIEEHWGAFRYNIFLLTGFALTVAVSFLLPTVPVTNTFVAGSVFLAFSFLYPDFVIYIFFVLPVRMKWLALITWLGYGYMMLFGSWSSRLMILASIGNFLIFFAGDLFWMAKQGRRKMSRQAAGVPRKGPESFHRCTVCGITDKSHPQMDFRYCPSCEGQYGYCTEHIFSHEHIRNS